MKYRPSCAVDLFNPDMFGYLESHTDIGCLQTNLEAALSERYETERTLCQRETKRLWRVQENG